MIAALFVQPRGIYTGREDVDPWPEDRDARNYAGPWPVVAHPPCAAWGRYAKPTPASTARGPLFGDDGGCFASALESVRRFGGVLEHPADSGAWKRYGLRAPPAAGGWVESMFGPGWTCCVDQGHYGHAARKPTWLYFVGAVAPPALIWGPSNPAPIGSGARRGNLESMSKLARARTPDGFAEFLIGLAAGATPDHPCRTLDPDSDCPECHVIWGEMADAMARVGANVRVSLPGDVAPWWAPLKLGASWVADVEGVNGDSLDVQTPTGDVEPVPIEYCRPWRVGTYTAPPRTTP